MAGVPTESPSSANYPLDMLSSGRARGSALLQQSVPPLPQSYMSRPLLAVQVTIFPQQGIASGVTLDHTACDGTSSTQFMHLWAATCRSRDKVPCAHVVIDRTLIPDPSNLFSVFYDEMVRRGLSNSKGKDKTSSHSALSRMVLASFTLKQEHIQRLKKMVSKKAQELKKSFHCSTLVVAFAYTWVGHVRAQCICSNKKSCFVLSADFRARIQPPLPTTYFGNCVLPCIAEAEPIDLMSNNGVIVAAEAIGKAIDGLSASLKSTDYIVNFFASLDKISLLASAGSPKFRVYNVDFRWGKPAKVEVASVARTGAVPVADSREEQGGLGIF